ncbi:hypothetical protein XF30_00415 [Bradyrhizobium sp. SUTN9-2]|nr:hypothetical protein XF30_00415 [Bradyrhizobium sp. SUTN9-2]
MIDVFLDALGLAEMSFEVAEPAVGVAPPLCSSNSAKRCFFWQRRGAATDGSKFNAVNSRDRNFTCTKME